MDVRFNAYEFFFNCWPEEEVADGFVSESFLEQESGKATVMPGLKLQRLKWWYKSRDPTHTFTTQSHIISSLAPNIFWRGTCYCLISVKTLCTCSGVPHSWLHVCVSILYMYTYTSYLHELQQVVLELFILYVFQDPHCKCPHVLIGEVTVQHTQSYLHACGNTETNQLTEEKQ